MSSLRSRGSEGYDDAGDWHQGHGQQQPYKDYNDGAADIDDSEVYNYALRVVLLQHVIASKPATPIVEPSTTSTTTKRDNVMTQGTTSSSSRPSSQAYPSTSGSSGSSSTWSALGSLSLSDVFRSSSSSSNSSSSSSPRYPERFLKVLEARIQLISTGHDKQYNDRLLRYTFANFYGKLKEPKHTRILKESRKLEDLIMMFIATATESLRKNTPSNSDEWKVKLDEHLECFVDILGTALRNKDLKHVPNELIVKLETLKSRMSSANRPQLPPQSQATSSVNNGDNANGYNSARTSMSLEVASSTSAGGSSNMSPAHSAGSTANTSIASTSSSSVSYSLSDIPAARQLGMLFDMSLDQVQRDINHLRKTCTEKNALADLKQCINLISMNAPFPACREDFLTEEAYKEWRSAELASLQQEMLSILQRSPELVKSASSEGREEGGSASTSAMSSAAAKRSSGVVITEAGEAYVGRRISSNNVNSSSRTSLPIAEQFASTLSFANSSSSSNVDDGYSGAGNTYSSAIPFPSSPVTSSSSNFANTTLHPDDPPSTASSSTSSNQLTFITPTSPRHAYIRLQSLMLSYDLEQMANLDPSEEVPLRILSKLNQDILQECFSRWRIFDSMRFVAFLSEMTDKYAKGEMPVVECVTEALGDFEELNEGMPVDNWPIVDRESFLTTISTLLDALLKGFYETYSEQLPAQAAASVFSAILQLSDIPVFDEAVPPEELTNRLDMLKDAIGQVSEYLYAQERGAIFAHHAAQRPSSPSTPTVQSQSQQQAHEPPVEAFLDLLNWIKTSAKRYDKHYRSPLFGTVDIPQHFLERVAELYMRELHYKFEQIQAVQKSKPLYTTPNDMTSEEKPPITDGEVMALYRGVKELTEMHKAFCPNVQLSISLNQQFEPYILRWLEETDTKTLTWVRNAINLDSFKPEDNVSGEEHDDGAEKYTSSIRDLVDSCKGALQFVTDLDWPDEYQNATFITRLSSTISKAIEQYCIAIEELYMREMAPRKRDSGGDRDERTHAWITRAKALYNQDKKLVMYQFQPTSCLKLNNIHGARDLLDKMYTAVDADKVAALTRARAPAVATRQAQRNLFTIKIVLGEGLATSDGVSRVDPFVTLSDERGIRIAKTRTLYETKEPRWSETFDISVEGKMWIAATIWNRNLVDEHELLGRTYIALDPAVFGDYLPHDLWQDLDTTGRLLLRVSMEGEKDDIQFFFGRAFRSLKRAENDMTRMIVDKISPFIRASISTNSLKSLLKRGGYTSYLKDLNLDKAFEKARLENGLEGVKNLKNLMKARDPNAPLIPLPAHMIDLDKHKPKPLLSTTSSSSATTDRKKATELTDAEIEEPLAPLLVYLDQSLETFRRHLSESAWQVVLTKIWKEVISVVESLLVPALSDQPTEMKPLSDKEVDIIFKWLKFLTDFFHADGQGVPMAELQNPRYRSVMLIRLYYDWSTDNLMEESVRLTNEQLKASAKGSGPTRSKSVYQQRNLGTIRQRKKEKHEEADSGAAEMVMRILRMRPQAIDFLQQQMGMLHLVQEKQKKPTRLLGSIRGRGRGKAKMGLGQSTARQRLPQGHHPLPPIPSGQSAFR